MTRFQVRDCPRCHFLICSPFQPGFVALPSLQPVKKQTQRLTVPADGTFSRQSCAFPSLALGRQPCPCDRDQNTMSDSSYTSEQSSSLLIQASSQPKVRPKRN